MNFWAGYYLERVPGLAEFLPFASKDVDLVGDAEDLYLLAKIVKGTLTKYRDVRQQLIGLLTSGDEPSLKFEVLRGIYGPVTLAQIQSRCRTVCGIRIADPISMLVSKCHNVAGIDQERRQDVRHVKMLAPVSNEYLLDVLAGVDEKITPRQLIKELRFLLDFSEDVQFQKGLNMAGHSLRDCLPMEELAELGERFPAISRFVENTLSSVLDN